MTVLKLNSSELPPMELASLLGADSHLDDNPRPEPDATEWFSLLIKRFLLLADRVLVADADQA